MDTLKNCVVVICATILIIALCGVYCFVNHLSNESDFLWFTGIIMIAIVIVYSIYTGLAYLLTLKLEENKVGALEKEFQRKKEWAEFELELRKKEAPLKMEWKTFEQELLLKAKNEDLQRSINEKDAEVRRSIEETSHPFSSNSFNKKYAELWWFIDRKEAELKLILQEKDTELERTIKEIEAHSQQIINEKNAAFELYKEAKKSGITVATSYDPSK